MQSTSPAFSMNGVDWQKVLTGLWVALAGAAITVLTLIAGANFHVVVGSTDLSPIITLVYSSACSTLVNVLRKYVTDHSQQPQ